MGPKDFPSRKASRNHNADARCMASEPSILLHQAGDEPQNPNGQFDVANCEQPIVLKLSLGSIVFIRLQQIISKFPGKGGENFRVTHIREEYRPRSQRLLFYSCLDCR